MLSLRYQLQRCLHFCKLFDWQFQQLDPLVLVGPVHLYCQLGLEDLEDLVDQCFQSDQLVLVVLEHQLVLADLEVLVGLYYQLVLVVLVAQQLVGRLHKRMHLAL